MMFSLGYNLKIVRGADYWWEGGSLLGEISPAGGGGMSKFLTGRMGTPPPVEKTLLTTQKIKILKK